MLIERSHRWIGLAAAALIVGCAAKAGGGKPISLADLDGSEWRLVSLGGDDPGGEMTMRFEGTKVTGKGGCNRYFGTVEGGEMTGSLAFGPIGATRMSCGDALDAAENRFLAALGAATRCAMESGRLVLAAEDAAELRLERVSGPSD